MRYDISRFSRDAKNKVALQSEGAVGRRPTGNQGSCTTFTHKNHIRKKCFRIDIPINNRWFHKGGIDTKIVRGVDHPQGMHRFWNANLLFHLLVKRDPTVRTFPSQSKVEWLEESDKQVRFEEVMKPGPDRTDASLINALRIRFRRLV